MQLIIIIIQQKNKNTTININKKLFNNNIKFSSFYFSKNKFIDLYHLHFFYQQYYIF